MRAVELIHHGLPPIDKTSLSNYSSPRVFGPSRDEAMRRLQAYNLSPRQASPIGPVVRLPGISPAPRRANFTQSFLGCPARRPPPLGKPPDAKLLAERRAQAQQKKRELEEIATRLAVERQERQARAHRRYLARRHKSAISIQARARAVIVRDRLHEERYRAAAEREWMEKSQAAVVIQKVGRGRLARTKIGGSIKQLRKLRERAAARAIQRHARRRQRRIRQQRKLLRANEAYFDTLRLRLEEDAARVIQRNVRKEALTTKVPVVQPLSLLDVVRMEAKAHAVRLIQNQMRDRARRLSQQRDGTAPPSGAAQTRGPPAATSRGRRQLAPPGVVKLDSRSETLAFGTSSRREKGPNRSDGSIK